MGFLVEYTVAVDELYCFEYYAMHQKDMDRMNTISIHLACPHQLLHQQGRPVHLAFGTPQYQELSHR